MYLKTHLDWFEYMKIPTDCISIWQHNQPLSTSRKRPQWIRLHGDLQRNVWAAAGWYPGQQLLKEWFARHGYFEQPHTPGLWKHVICPVRFNLCVDNFGIKYIGCKNLPYLYNALRKETYEFFEWSHKQPILWDYIEIELRETPCVSCYASLCHETTHKIQSCCSLITTALPVCTQFHQIWQRPSITLPPWWNSLPKQSTKKKCIQKLLAVSCTMREQWILLYLWHCWKLPHNKRRQLRIRRNKSINFLITCGHIQMQLFSTMPLTWFSIFILTRRTSLHQKISAVLVLTSFLAVSHKMETQLNWMEPLISHEWSSSLLLLLQQKQNWVHFF